MIDIDIFARFLRFLCLNSGHPASDCQTALGVKFLLISGLCGSLFRLAVARKTGTTDMESSRFGHFYVSVPAWKTVATAISALTESTGGELPTETSNG